MKKLTGFLFILFCVTAGSAYAADSELVDGVARIDKIHGHAVLIQNGSPVEKSLKVGDAISAGDSVYTGKGASLTINFDGKKKNVVRLPQDSKVIFQSIEPTEIKLENGSVFSIVDGLTESGTWKVSTPAIVAAVRGTVFVVHYGMAAQKNFIATLNVPDDGKNSAVEVRSLTNGSSALIEEGKQLELNRGEAVDPRNVKKLSLKKVNEAQRFLSEVKKERSEMASQTGDVPTEEILADFTETVCDPSGKNCAVKKCRMTESGKVCNF